jgi:hypothetical protein
MSYGWQGESALGIASNHVTFTIRHSTSGVSPKELFKNQNDRFLQFLVTDIK